MKFKTNFNKQFNTPFGKISAMDLLFLFLAIDVAFAGIFLTVKIYPTFATWLFAFMLLYLPVVIISNFIRYRRKVSIFTYVSIIIALVLLAIFLPKYTVGRAIDTVSKSISSQQAGTSVQFVEHIDTYLTLEKGSNWFSKYAYVLVFNVNNEKQMYYFNEYYGDFHRLTTDQENEILNSQKAAD